MGKLICVSCFVKLISIEEEKVEKKTKRWWDEKRVRTVRVKNIDRFRCPGKVSAASKNILIAVYRLSVASDWKEKRVEHNEMKSFRRGGRQTNKSAWQEAADGWFMGFEYSNREVATHLEKHCHYTNSHPPEITAVFRNDYSSDSINRH